MIICVLGAIPAYAALPHLVDDANLLTPSEENALLDQLDSISAEYHFDVIIVTVEELGYQDVDSFADNFYNNGGYGDDGILLLISMEDRDWAITATGYGQTAFTDAGMEYIADQILWELSDDNFYEAFRIFADQCDIFLAQAKTGDPFDSHNLPKEPFSIVFNLLIAVVIGFVIALIVTAIMKSGLKSVRYQAAASNYVKPGSMKVTQSKEIFLYRRVDRTKKPQQTNTSSGTRSSGGRSFSGRSGKF